MSTPKKDWNDILQLSARIVQSYSTGVTLRQLFYQLVSRHVIENNQNNYKTLSKRTAAARRDGWFPDLIDRTRTIREPYPTFESTREAKDWLKKRYIRDRAETQEYAIYLGVEKAGIVEQLLDWFGRPLHLPILPLGGYTSQTFVQDIINHVEDDGRKSVLIYAGDFDPSGMDIDRDMLERTAVFDYYHRVALTQEIVEEYGLPPAMGKATDSRAASFEARYGELVQVELDALDPHDLQKLYKNVIDDYFDYDKYQEVVDREEEERDSL